MSDIVIVGGGIVGCALAYECSRRGASITLLERDFVGSGATSAAAGMLAPQAEADQPGPLFDLGLASRKMFEELVGDLREETGLGVDLDLGGILRLAHREETAADLRRRAVWQRGLGCDARSCDPAEVLALAPGLRRAPLEALWVPDGRVDAFALARVLTLAARRHGATVREGVGVAALRSGELTTTEGPVHGETIILAAGAWTGPLADVSIQPVKGQRMLLRAAGPSPSRLPLFGDDCYLVPKPGGHWLAGATVEPGAGFDRRVTLGAVHDLARAAADLCSDLAAAEPVEFRAGLRPGTPDGLPLLGPLSACPGVWVAAGHGRNGILLAPLTARLLADAILEGRPLPSACDPQRFGPNGYRTGAAPAGTGRAERLGGAPAPAAAPPAEQRTGTETPTELELTTIMPLPPLEALRAFADISRWQAHMADVRRVTVLARGEGWQVSAWVVGYLGQEVRWEQRDEFDEEHTVIHCQQLAGTVLRTLEVWCRFEPLAGGTRVRVRIVWEAGRLAGLVMPAVREVMRRNYAGLIAGIVGSRPPAGAD